MADRQIGNIHGVAAKSIGSGQEKTNQTGDSDGNVATAYKDADLLDVDAMRARLAVIDAAYYTSARLNTMTYNDMMYAIRLADAPGTI